MVPSEYHRALNGWVRSQHKRGWNALRNPRLYGLTHSWAHVRTRWCWSPRSRKGQRHLAHLVRDPSVVQWRRGEPLLLWTRTWCSGSIYNPAWRLGDVHPGLVECELCILNHRKAAVVGDKP